MANALWAGGAEAMTIQGQRVVSTTGIKCVGNTVVLHGVPYSPPYRISAIGPTGEMLASVNASPYIGSTWRWSQKSGSAGTSRARPDHRHARLRRVRPSWSTPGRPPDPT